LESIAKYKGDVGINLWICGNAEQSEFRNFPFVHFLGYKTGIELDELFDIAHIAIGGFAFDKIGLKEGSTLKLREYVARGIPVVYGHSDTDIDPLIEKGLVMKFTENQFPEMDKILNFAASFYKNPAHVDELHNFAVNNLDYTVKMKKLVEDIQSGDNKKD
jgi:hypothetical protein